MWLLRIRPGRDSVGSLFDFEEGSDVMRTGEELFFGYASALDAATVSSRVAVAAVVSVVSTPYDTWISGDDDNSFL
jgi:hypothetical protein